MTTNPEARRDDTAGMNDFSNQLWKFSPILPAQLQDYFIHTHTRMICEDMKFSPSFQPN